MRLTLFAIGQRRPRWEQQGFENYACRLPNECKLDLVEIPAAKRPKQGNADRAITEEGDRLLAAVPKGGLTIALDEHGEAWTTEALAANLRDWMQHQSKVALMIGGADGLAAACLQRAHRSWSLSPLTLPHGLVRILVAEQVYRAWSILKNHPYHRA